MPFHFQMQFKSHSNSFLGGQDDLKCHSNSIFGGRGDLKCHSNSIFGGRGDLKCHSNSIFGGRGDLKCHSNSIFGGRGDLKRHSNSIFDPKTHLESDSINPSATKLRTSPQTKNKVAATKNLHGDNFAVRPFLRTFAPSFQPTRWAIFIGTYIF